MNIISTNNLQFRTTFKIETYKNSKENFQKKWKFDYNINLIKTLKLEN